MAKQPKTQPVADPPADEQPSKQQMLLEGQELETEETASPPAAAAEPPAEPGTSDTTETTSPETPDAQETTAAAAEPTFLEAIKELGYQGEDEHEAAQTLLESYRALMQDQQSAQQRLSEMEELARYGTEYLKKEREAAEPEPTPDTPPPGSEPWWNPPKFEAKWLEQYRDVTVGADGQPVLGWKKNTPREVQEAAEGYQQYLEQWATDLVQRPQEVLPKIIEQEFDRLFEDRIKARDEALELSTFAERVRDTNRDWMYTTDSRGQEKLTAEGEVMTRLLGEVAQSGVTNPQLQWQYAVAMYDYLNRQNQAAASEQTTQVKETAAQQRRQQLERGAKKPTHNRTGTVQRPEEESTRAQNPHLSPGQQLLQQLRQDGADI